MQWPAACRMSRQRTQHLSQRLQVECWETMKESLNIACNFHHLVVGAMASSLRLEDLRRPLLASVFLLLPVLVPSELIFNFTYFSPNTDGIIYSGDAHASGGDRRVIQLTRNQVDESLYRSTGRAVFSAPIDLWDSTTGMVSDFTTTFKFKIIIFNTSEYGDGLAFFMAPAAYRIPRNSGGGYLGLYNSSYNSSNFVAVEFDTFMNSWDPDGNHVGIDINNIVSDTTAPFPGDLKDATTWSAKISYESKSNTLFVHLMDPDQEARDGVPTRPILSYTTNLKDVLPPKVIVGFSATTGGFLELHQVISWDFMTVTDTGGCEGQAQETSPSKRHVPWVVAVVLCTGFVTAASGYVVFFRRWRGKKKQRELDRSFYMPKKQSEHDDNDCSIDCNIFMTGNGPRKFSYKELVMATDNFCEERKLGQGGFGGVYMGFLGTNMPEKVAVKKISRNSSQGKKEYISEVTAISQLRHRNLVRLIGWCHEDGELLLVYEYMLNGSLDMYLFGRKKPLAWALRNKIAVGLATALLYLHEEWDQCVVHRDIKASNVMLDSDFNAKLGDFGLARLVDHAVGGQNTMLAGTMGYLAPECVMMGRASKESDVYSFGVVALEIACGRKSIEPTKLLSEVKLVDWVWEQYGNLTILAVADQRLKGEYDHEQMERMMVLGLWCTHPDNKLRPSIREAIQVLTCEAPMPRLPKSVPKPVYNPVPMNMMNVLYDTLSQELSGTGTIRYDGQCNTSSHASSSPSSDSSARNRSFDDILGSVTNSENRHASKEIKTHVPHDLISDCNNLV